MDFAEVFVVFFVSHLAGDFLLQTDWQARHKRGGLGRDPISRRALLSHVALYTLAFVPATIWLADEHGVAALGLLALVVVPHLVQDDGRLLTSYIRVMKQSDIESGALFVAVDQSFHSLMLLGVALLAAT